MQERKIAAQIHLQARDGYSSMALLTPQTQTRLSTAQAAFLQTLRLAQGLT